MAKEKLGFEEKPDYESEIIRVIKGNYSPRAALEKLEDYHGSDIAQAMDSLTLQERKKLYRILNADMLSDTLERLDDDEAAKYINEMDIKKAAQVVSNLETDSAADILMEINKEKRLLLIEELNPEVKKDIKLIASFDEDEIGSKMTTNCIVIRENLSVKEAMKELVSQAKKNDNITTIFVTDENEEYYGAIDLKDLITADSETPLDDLIA